LHISALGYFAREPRLNITKVSDIQLRAFSLKNRPNCCSNHHTCKPHHLYLAKVGLFNLKKTNHTTGLPGIFRSLWPKLHNASTGNLYNHRGLKMFGN